MAAGPRFPPTFMVFQRTPFLFAVWPRDLRRVPDAQAEDATLHLAHGERDVSYDLLPAVTPASSVSSPRPGSLVTAILGNSIFRETGSDLEPVFQAALGMGEREARYAGGHRRG